MVHWIVHTNIAGVHGISWMNILPKMRCRCEVGHDRTYPHMHLAKACTESGISGASNCQSFDGFLRIGVPPVIIHFTDGIFHSKPSINWGIPIFRKPPFGLGLGLCPFWWQLMEPKKGSPPTPGWTWLAKWSPLVPYNYELIIPNGSIVVPDRAKL